MKGWVYVITNEAMPGIVKVGYTLKDPDIRARNLNHTGSPTPYVVDYELLVENPKAIEKATHELLAAKREGKEWFKCTSEEAIAAIKQIVNDEFITENYKRAEREKAEALYRSELHKREIIQKQLQCEQEKKAHIAAEEAVIRKKYQDLRCVIRDECNKRLQEYDDLKKNNFLDDIFILTLIVAIFLAMVGEPKNTGSWLFLSFIIGLIIRFYFNNNGRMKLEQQITSENEKKLNEIKKQEDEELNMLHKRKAQYTTIFNHDDYRRHTMN